MNVFFFSDKMYTSDADKILYNFTAPNVFFTDTIFNIKIYKEQQLDTLKIFRKYSQLMGIFIKTGKLTKIVELLYYSDYRNHIDGFCNFEREAGFCTHTAEFLNYKLDRVYIDKTYLEEDDTFRIELYIDKKTFIKTRYSNHFEISYGEYDDYDEDSRFYVPSFKSGRVEATNIKDFLNYNYIFNHNFEYDEKSAKTMINFEDFVKNTYQIALIKQVD